jgi:hypothetical protein
MPDTPKARAAQLVDGQVDPPVPVPASVIRDFSPSRLADVEAAWKQARELAAEALAQKGQGGEHGHWDWQNKVWATESGRHRLIAIDCLGAVQGLMAVLTAPRPAVLGNSAEPILYVDYLESAPWNLKGLHARPQCLGVGTLLIAEAVKLSLESGWCGRVGLHSLPQAEKFYRVHCRMTRIGPDADYYDLAYFEYTEEQAAKWLAEVGLS